MNNLSLKQLKEIIKNKGASLKPNGANANLKSGYMVSYANSETVFELKEKITSTLLKTINNQYFNAVKEKGIYIGFWIDNNKLYIDISKRYNTKILALKVAKDNRQLAIFDNKSGKSIYLTA